MLNLHLSLELSLLMEETLLHKVCFCYLVCNNFSISIFSQWLVETGKRGVAVVKNKIYLHLKHLHLSHVNCRYHTLNIQPACLLQHVLKNIEFANFNTMFQVLSIHIIVFFFMIKEATIFHIYLFLFILFLVK